MAQHRRFQLIQGRIQAQNEERVYFSPRFLRHDVQIIEADYYRRLAISGIQRKLAFSELNPYPTKIDFKGICWTISPSECASYALKIANPDVEYIALSANDILDNVPPHCRHIDYDCHGWPARDALVYMSENGAVREADRPYENRKYVGRDRTLQEHLGLVHHLQFEDLRHRDEFLLMERCREGPFVAMIIKNATFENLRSLEIFRPLEPPRNGDGSFVDVEKDHHYVTIVSYDEKRVGTGMVRYWNFRNSHGPNFGENGYGRVLRWSSCYEGEISIYHTMQPRFPRLSLGMNPNRSSLGVDLQQSGRDKVENQIVARKENKSQSGSTISGPTTAGGNNLVGAVDSLIGLSVEVQVKGGSVFSRIRHKTNAEKDLGSVLKTRGQTPFLYSFNKAPLKAFLIPDKDLVQMTAKDVSVTKEDFENDLQRVKEEEIMIGSFILQNRHADAERELGRWVPDDPQCPELDNIFDGHWNRESNQFEANATLFGVKSNFDEELYTTKLERGTQMRELEREAASIAREIEGEETQDLHLAEERGAQFLENIDIDDCGYDENEDIFLDSQNNETFGDTSSSVLNKSFANLTFGKTNVEAQVPSCSSSTGKKLFSIRRTTGDTHRSDSSTHRSDSSDNSSSATGSEHRIQENQFNKMHVGCSSIEVREEFSDEARTSKPEERELERWFPDDDLQCTELDNIFDGQWNRGCDQFETNALFGFKSTFERGQHM